MIRYLATVTKREKKTLKKLKGQKSVKKKTLVTIGSICIVGLTLLALQSKTKNSPQDIGEKPFVIIVPSYNNSEWVDKNLNSIFSQAYTNYRVIYIDDCSSDNTYELVKNYVEQHNLCDRITIIKNSLRKGAMANHFTAGHMCMDHEVMVHLDGDDWFKHDHVLQKVNQAYADPNVWMTYGQYEIYPGGKVGICREFPPIVHEKNIYREYEWISSALRTFYAWLFKRIFVKDFLYHGMWFSVNCDRIIMYSLLEMARERCRFIPDILYVYNCVRPENDYKQHLLLQWHCNHVICSRPKYTRIHKSPDFTQDKKNLKTNMIIFSNENPLLTQAVMQSAELNISDIYHIFLLYPSTNTNIEKSYEQLVKKYKNIVFCSYNRGIHSNLPNLIQEILSQTDYVLFADDSIIITRPIDLNACIEAIKKTHAYGFYLTLGKNITNHPYLQRAQKLPPFIDIEDTISAWQFECGEYDWKKPQSISLGLYDARRVKNALAQVTYDSPQLLEELWASIPFDMTHVGLCYNQSPAIIFDETITPETSLALFQQGLKLDVSTVAGIDNKSIRISQEIPLIS